MASAPSRPPGKACPLPSPPHPRQQPEVHDALCSGCRSPFTRFSCLSLAGTMCQHETEPEAWQTSGWQPELSPYKFSVLPFHPNSRGFGKTPLLWGRGGGWRGERSEREKYTNAPEQLQFAERASERTKWQQGARRPPEAACPTEHSAGGDAPGCTWASPKPRGSLRGRGARRKAQPSPQTCGGEADLPSRPPPQTRPAPAGSVRACGLGTLQPWDVGARWLGFPIGRGVFEGLSSPSCKRCVLPALKGWGGSRPECLAIPAKRSDLLPESLAPSPGLLLPPLSLWLKQEHTWMLVVLYNLGWRMKSSAFTHPAVPSSCRQRGRSLKDLHRFPVRPRC